MTLWLIGFIGLIAWGVLAVDGGRQSRAADGSLGVGATFWLWLAAGMIALYAFSALIEVVT